MNSHELTSSGINLISVTSGTGSLSSSSSDSLSLDTSARQIQNSNKHEDQQQTPDDIKLQQMFHILYQYNTTLPSHYEFAHAYLFKHMVINISHRTIPEQTVTIFLLQKAISPPGNPVNNKNYRSSRRISQV